MENSVIQAAATGIHIIPDFPTGTPAPWLTVEEKLLAQPQRMLEGLRGVKTKETGKSVFVEAFSD